LLQGSIDAAAVSDLVLRDPQVLQRLGQDLRILATTAAILPDPILVSTDLSVALQQRLRNLFHDVETQPEGRELLASLSQTLDISGFQPLTSETDARGGQEQ
jgi:ABC-type phosphate/phosphonate transport system substrate-binding protein